MCASDYPAFDLLGTVAIRLSGRHSAEPTLRDRKESGSYAQVTHRLAADSNQRPISLIAGLNSKYNRYSIPGGVATQCCFAVF